MRIGDWSADVCSADLAEATPGPWLSRPMQAAFGLPLPERGIGLAAHAFYQAFCAPRVYLTRAERVDGTPTVPARWLRPIDAQIGRASCRDRVCQLVDLGGGRINKKKKQTTTI